MGIKAIMMVDPRVLKAARRMRNTRLRMPDDEDELRKSIIDGDGALNVADKRW
jgi:hypothetical protein